MIAWNNKNLIRLKDFLQKCFVFVVYILIFNFQNLAAMFIEKKV